MRVLVLWADDDSKNLGVRALAAGVEALCRTTWGDVEIAHASYGFKEVPVRLWSYRDLSVELLTRRHGFATWVAQFDVVLDTRAGDSFADIYGLRRHSNMSAVAEIVRQAGVPLVMSPQTIGPFATRRARVLARRSMHTASLVMARDSASAEVARSLGCAKVLQSTDVVFALDRPARSAEFDVLLNISGLLWIPNHHVDHLAYRETAMAVYRGLREQGRTVALLSHVLDSPYPDNDTPACHEFAAETGEDPTVLIPRDLPHVRELVASASLVVGSRMHACLNAISVGTPAIALAYSRKFTPLLHDIGWTMSLDLREGVAVAPRVVELAAAPDLDDQARRAMEAAHARLAVCQSALRSLM